ncbi:hypothetical protein C8Q80DRAFT_767299 [Daedaleopsis nitida]|nr:hypothetical protein C8Q80DRAFT_767299 [Daedaleopsis nitida]
MNDAIKWWLTGPDGLNDNVSARNPAHAAVHTDIVQCEEKIVNRLQPQTSLVSEDIDMSASECSTSHTLGAPHDVPKQPTRPTFTPALPAAFYSQRNHERGTAVRRSVAPYTKPFAGCSRSVASGSMIIQPPTTQYSMPPRDPRNSFMSAITPALPPASGPQRNHERSTDVRQSVAPYTKPFAGCSRSVASGSTIIRPTTTQYSIPLRNSRDPPILVRGEAVVDSFHTVRNACEDLARVSVWFTCPFDGCNYSGDPSDLKEHIVAHKPGTVNDKNQVRCPWSGCRKSVQLQNLPRHIEDMHLHLRSLHCPYCHETKQASHYHKLHGDANKCSRRADPVEMECHWCATEVSLV